MSDNDRIPVTIYLLDLIPFEEDGFDFVVNEIIKRANEKQHNCKPQQLDIDPPVSHRIRLYSAISKKKPKWLPFLEKVLDKDAPVRTYKNTIISFVCFIQFDYHIYAIAGGLGSDIIERYIAPNFGLDLLVRLLDIDSKVIKKIQERGVSGIILGQTKSFRGDQRLSDENGFGKIFKEVKAEMSKSILIKTFGFAKEELKRKSSGALFNSSFKISKAIDFITLLRLVEKFEEIKRLPEKYPLNKVHLISKRHPEGAKLIRKLNDYFREDIYEKCKKGEELDVDFCHSDFESYLDASEYIMKLNDVDQLKFYDPVNFEELIHLVIAEQNEACKDIYHFNSYVLDRSLITLDDEGNQVTIASVWDHLHGEIVYEEKSYFRVDGEWYQVLQSFIDDLNKAVELMLIDHWDTKLMPKPFDLSKRESYYNNSYIGSAQTYVFDTITPDNIEICDICMYEPGSVNLIHVKKGFDNSVRELASQILISAKRIQEDIRSGFRVIDKLEKQAKNASAGSKISSQIFPKGGLKTIFKDVSPKNITFCFAFVDKADSVRSLKDNLKSFRSNIAKYSLHELRKEIVGMGFDFKVIQLKRTQNVHEKK